jgi:uncharacterized Zn finger protein
MKGWEPGYTRGPKKPPPPGGIKLKKAGTTWWGLRWIEALERVLGADGKRLGRGRTYARAGRTHDLIVHAGQVRAKVTGSREAPYEVSIELAQLPAETWAAAIAGMAAKAQFAAELLAGEMPLQIDEVFRAAATSLFPSGRDDLQTSCSCPDWGDPCKHVAATHYVLGEAFDRDPFLLFELRGRKKDEVLEALRRARAGAPTGATTPVPEQRREEVPRVALAALELEGYDRAREPLPKLELSFAPPLTHGSLLRQLGLPAAWDRTEAPADALSPLIQRAAEVARRIALAEPEPAAAEPEPRAAEPALRSPAAAPRRAGKRRRAKRG